MDVYPEAWVSRRSRLDDARRVLALHWPEYLFEAAGLGLFMISACMFTVLLFHPASRVVQVLPDADSRRLLIGIAMGLSAIAIIYSPLGKRSGAHLNPAVTLTFWRLSKIDGWDALFYIIAQFIGGAIGVLIAEQMLSRMLIADMAVNYAVTVPGASGAPVALAAEAAISFGLMLMVLIVSNQQKLNRYTGLFAGSLVALYITFEAPLSGMSMNPARTLASALPAHVWTGAWLYFIGPPLGMLLAAEVYLLWRGQGSVLCCKLHHENHSRCIFRCRYHSCAGAGG